MIQKTLPAQAFFSTTANMYFMANEEKTAYESWVETKESFLADEMEAEKIAFLVEELKRDGSFAYGIEVYTIEDYFEESELNEHSDHVEYIMSDGAHRAVAYMILSEEDPLYDVIPFSIYEEEAPSEREYPSKYYETKVVMEGGEDFLYPPEDVIDVLTISHPTSSREGWIQAETVSAVGSEFIVFWGEPVGEYSIEEVERLIVRKLLLAKCINDEQDVFLSTSEEIF